MRVAIGLRLEANEDWEQAATYVTEAERVGVDFVWSHESWGLDAATPLAFMAARTSRIRLGSGIMQAGTRTPALVAMTALSLASMSSGRFVLGMGVSGPQVIEGWHGLRFDRPLTRMREIGVAVRKPGLAFTLGAMGSRQHNFYNDAFKRAGYADAATEVQRLWLDGKRDEAAARVPDEMARKANLLGTEAMVRERLHVYRASGLTTMRVDPAGATIDARLATLGRLMELVKTL